MTKDQLLRIIHNKIDISHFIIMHIIDNQKEISELWADVKIRSIREALIKKKLVFEESTNVFCLTNQGIELYNKCSDNQSIQLKIEKSENSYLELAKLILDEIKTYSKKKYNITNIKLKSGFMFTSSSKEIAERLQNYCIHFKTNDFDKIKKACMLYTKDVLDNSLSFPRKLIYFIYKNVNGQIVSDLNNYIENNIDEEETIVKDTRNLF